MDEELVHMARSQSAARLAIGDAFVALGMAWQELGFSSFGAYVRERCARSARWGEETRALARRLAALPRIRAQLASGMMGWCMADVLSRVATAQDEEGLLETTRGMTVRAVKEALRERGDEDEVRFGTLEVNAAFEVAWALETTRPMAELVDGRSEPGAWLEAMLAEAQCALSNIAPGVDPVPEDVARRQAQWLESIAEGKRCMDNIEAMAEEGLPPMPEAPIAPAAGPLPSEALAIDRMIVRELAPRLARCDVRFGELLGRFFGARGWRTLGFATETQYARERLGSSRAAVRSRITLARRAMGLGAIDEALREGAIGYESAGLIARVATPDTVTEWVDRARTRTFKHLREEVSAVEQITRMMRLADCPGPPTDDEVKLVHALEADAKSGAYARRAFGIERDDDAPPPRESLVERVSAPYSALAESATVVEEALRTVLARARAASPSADDAMAACVGVAPPGAVATIDLEADLALGPDAVVQMFEEEPVRHDVEAAPRGADPAAPALETSVQMFGDFGDAAPRGHAAADPPIGDGSAAPVPETPVQMFGDAEPVAVRRRLGKVTLRVRAREDVIVHFRMLEAAYERAGLGDDFVSFLVLAFWSTWAELLGRTNAWESVLRRDRYLCTSPVCDRPCAPGPHHVVFRAHGGGDEPANNTSGCDRCHIHGVHAGRIRVEGCAPDLLTWLIGRTPILEVRGRERRLLV